MIKTQNVVKLLQIKTSLSTKSLNGYCLQVFYTHVSIKLFTHTALTEAKGSKNQKELNKF